MHIYKSSYILFFILSIVLLLSCGNIFGNKKSYGNIKVLVMDNKNNPISGAIISTYPSSKNVITDNEGRATIENIQVGEYRLVVQHSDGYIVEKIINLNADKDIDIDIIFLFSNIRITLKDNKNNPIAGASITTYPPTSEVTTDQTGVAVLENLFAKEYTIVVVYENSEIYRKNLNLKSVEDQNLDIIVYYSSVEITIKDDFERPVPGVVITTRPETTEIITDENGKGIIEIITGKDYTLYVNDADYVIYWENIKILEYNKITIINVVYETKLPEITILSPQNNDSKFLPPFIFSGFGNDKEDGELPDSSLVWSSSVDGELGYGRELVVDWLSGGKHVITLTGTDSDQKKGEASVNFTFIKITPKSYFPIPANSTWIYRHLESEFTIINEYSETEEWKLKDIYVSIDNNKRRTSYMVYQVLIEKNLEIYNYKIVDYLKEDQEENIYVTKSQEYIKVMQNGTVTQEMEITTIYTPHYVLIKNFMDPTIEKTYENNFTAEVTWYYHNVIWGSKELVETFDSFTTINVGDMERISTKSGVIDAVPVTIVQGNSVKKWWLSSGIGIVRIEYNTIKTNSIADIYSTNITDLLSPQKIPAPRFTTITIDKKSIQEGSEKKDFRDMKKKLDFFRSISPR